MVMAAVRTTKITMMATTAMAVPLMFTTMPATTLTMRASLSRRRGQQSMPLPLPPPPIKGTMTPAAMKIPPHVPPLLPPLPCHCCLWQVRRRGSAPDLPCWELSRTSAQARTTKTRTRTTTTRLTMATLSGGRWDTGRSASGSWTRVQQRPKPRRPGLPGDEDDNKEVDNDDGARLDNILPPLPPLFPPPSCDRCSRGCIPPPTMARTFTARNYNASLLLVARVLNSATTMWTTVRTRILRRQTGGGGYHDGDKSNQISGRRQLR